MCSCVKLITAAALLFQSVLLLSLTHELFNNYNKYFFQSSNLFWCQSFGDISFYVCSLYTERQKSCTTFSFDFFWIEIDDYKNQCSLVFMPVQKTIVAEKMKCV